MTILFYLSSSLLLFGMQTITVETTTFESLLPIRHSSSLVRSSAFVSTTSQSLSCRSKKRRRRSSSTSSVLQLNMAKTKTKSRKNNPVQPLQNELSRTINTATLSRTREISTQITANTEELENLAQRFHLSKIDKLHANLVVTNAQPPGSSTNRGGGSRQRGGDDNYIQVEGEVIASVMQTCVRTNEDFDIDMAFDLFAVVSPTTSSSSQRDLDAFLQDGRGEGMKVNHVYDDDDNNDDFSYSNRKKKYKKGGKGKRRSTVFHGDEQSLNPSRVKEIEQMLQEVDFEDDLVEDEAVLGDDGVLDVGELVAQTFRMKLEPFPKKPGTEPVRISISG